MDGKIYRGVLTGLNEAFVIDEAAKDRLIAEDAKSAEVIKPFLAGRDIKRYRTPRAEKYLIFPRRGIDIEAYPAILSYLSQYRERLEPRPKDWKDKKWPGRKPGSYKWYEIQDAVDYYEEFEKTKIIVPAIVNRASYAIDKRGHYSNDKTSIISVDDLYLFGLINSKAIDFLITQISSTKRGGYYEYKPMYVGQLPIHPNPTPEIRGQINENVEQILVLKQSSSNTDTTALEAEIDQLVYELYGLTEEEIAIVEEAVKG